MFITLLQAQEGLLIFCLAVICAFSLNLSKLYHPNTIFTLITSNLAKRVVRKGNKVTQHKLSGALACILPTLTIIMLLYTLSYISFYPQWFGGLILFLCLDTHFEGRAKRIARLLSQGQKGSAKQLLASIVNRDTTKLSEVGIIKASLDSLALNTIRHFYLIIIFYLIAGPYLALTYKLLLLCDQSWRKQLCVQHPFMTAVQKIIYLLEWLPIRCFVLIMALTQNLAKTQHYLKHYAQHYVNKNSGWIMALFSASLNVQLAGPRFYHDERFDNIRIGSDRQPTVEDMQHMLKLLNSMRWFWLGLTVLIWFAINLV
ncbi:cobalamin biosynthesis protein CobD/CbiB [Pseudoalteromonas obscura]|uniref:Cobalamin biosynthesis protein n=1 Tax=Pseudoalteromonas obscura TaxID=3048491 RepID=A0ABT7ELC2_9GAMM|nr:cobalamin biosynthesis protein [Pseudoalteromonas sp. P94(2023)]MDK2595846.1 cobalamin biosynthesis protein [Pseudoalteromonas sp. P94(2023)]